MRAATDVEVEELEEDIGLWLLAWDGPERGTLNDHGRDVFADGAEWCRCWLEAIVGMFTAMRQGRANAEAT